MTQEDKYNVNFFKPLTQHAKANTRLILTLAIIWAVGVFGFQILLMVFNEPTPEANFTKFEEVWPVVVESNSVAPNVKQDFAKVTLAVLGKNIAVNDNHKAYLKEALSWTVYSMQDDSMKAVFDFSDAMILALVFPNMIGLFFLFPVVRDELVKYLKAINVRLTFFK